MVLMTLEWLMIAAECQEGKKHILICSLSDDFLKFEISQVPAGLLIL